MLRTDPDQLGIGLSAKGASLYQPGAEAKLEPQVRVAEEIPSAESAVEQVSTQPENGTTVVVPTGEHYANATALSMVV